jgi:hypothetical protein
MNSCRRIRHSSCRTVGTLCGRGYMRKGLFPCLARAGGMPEPASGPGTRFRMQARLHRGDVLFADTRSCMIERPDIWDNKMEWTYVNSVPRFDGPLKEEKHFTRGWVARNFIQKFLCPSDE